MKAPRHWPLWEEYTGDRWIPQRASNAENVSIWWRHHVSQLFTTLNKHTFCWLLFGGVLHSYPLSVVSNCLSFVMMTSSMETFSPLLALCVGNSPATGEIPSQRSVTRSVDAFFDLRLNKQLNKQSWGCWFGTPSRSLWRHCNGYNQHISILFLLYTLIWDTMTSVNTLRILKGVTKWEDLLVYFLGTLYLLILTFVSH